MKFLTYDGTGAIGFVQSGGSDLEVTTPYTLAQSKEICKRLRDVAQHGDTVYMVHESHAPRKLVRVSATSFTLSTYVRTADPFTGADAYPRCVALHAGAAYFAATNDKRTTIFRSKIGDYDNMTTGTADDDGFEYAVDNLTETIEWLKPGANALIAGTAQALVAIYGDSPNDPITPSTVNTKLTSADGSNSTVAIEKDALLFYIENQSRKLNYFSYDLVSEAFSAKDANLAAHDITKGGISQLVYKKDRNNLIWSVRNDEELVSLNFHLEESIVGWHEHTSQATISQISHMQDNDGKAQLFALLKYGSDYYVCRYSEGLEIPLYHTFYTGDEDADKKAYAFYVAERLKEANHLDISSKVENNYSTTITYTGDTAVGSSGTITSTGTEFGAGDVDRIISFKTDTGLELGWFQITSYTANNEVDVEVLYEPTSLTYADWYLSFDTLTGLSDWNGETVRVVGDGGDMGDFVVAGGEVDLGKQVSVAWVGFSYTGLIKTFSLGLPLGNGVNTQATVKNVLKSEARMVQSAGGEIGTTLYDMEEIQEFSPAGYFNVPPLPIDGLSHEVTYNDGFEKDKSVWIRQATSVPLQITALFTDVEHTGNV